MYLSRVAYLGPHTKVTAHEVDLSTPGAYVSALVVLVFDIDRPTEKG